MAEIGHGGAGDLHTIFYDLFKLMKHPISTTQEDPW